jgi:hypothetical protein
MHWLSGKIFGKTEIGINTKMSINYIKTEFEFLKALKMNLISNAQLSKLLHLVNFSLKSNN